MQLWLLIGRYYIIINQHSSDESKLATLFGDDWLQNLDGHKNRKTTSEIFVWMVSAFLSSGSRQSRNLLSSLNPLCLHPGPPCSSVSTLGPGPPGLWAPAWAPRVSECPLFVPWLDWAWEPGSRRHKQAFSGNLSQIIKDPSLSLWELSHTSA